ncbi:hypothetical protein VPH35_110709 [Triticum aestivum]
MLALQLHFRECSQVKMLPSFLRCFPNLGMLIVEVPHPFSCFISHLEHHQYIESDRCCIISNSAPCAAKLFAYRNCSLLLKPPAAVVSSSGRRQVLLSVSSRTLRLLSFCELQGIITSLIFSCSSWRMHQSWRGCSSK